MAKKAYIVGSGNVFADIGHPRPAEALAKAELARKIGVIIEHRGLTQAAAAAVLQVDQPKVSALIRGRLAGFSLDRLAIAPYTSPMGRIIRPLRDVSSLIVQAPTQADLAEGMEAARSALRSLRGLRAGEVDDFGLVTQDAAFGFIKELKGRLVLFGTALPAISLVVGAMVIMNIMLVAVAERTREIGVRKALGARRSDILSQFLVEATTLSVLGAAIGIALGIGLAELIAALTPLPAAVAPWSIAAALITGAGVGIAAGMYPASRASQLDPIAALRQE